MSDDDLSTLERDRRNTYDNMALKAMSGEDRVRAQENEDRPEVHLKKEYGIDPRDYHDPEKLRADVNEAASGGDD
jgi:hypothetical protein